jgi:predicted permease
MLNALLSVVTSFELNLSNFLFARISARSHEEAILSALGASRFELARQPFLESLILACSGTLLGLATIVPLVHALVRFFPKLSGTDILGSLIDWRVFLFSVLITFACTLIVATYPVVWSVIKAPSELLREANAISGKKSSSLLGHALLATQIMIATVLVFGTTFFVGTLQTLERNDTGFTAQNLILASLDPPSSGYDLQRSQAFYTNLVDRVRVIPGVRNAALSRLVALASGIDSNTICVENYHPGNNEKMEQNINTISPGYFSTVGIPVFSGRDFNEHDNAGSPKVAIINRKMAADFFGSTNPIGHKIGIGCGDPKDANIEIVGVVNNARYESLRDTAVRIAYIPYLQNDENMRLTLNVNTAVSNTGEIFSALRHEANALDANIPLFELRTLQDQMNQSMWQEHTMARLSSFFSVLALFLAGLGVYSVLNYSIQRRKKEIGLRLSLGLPGVRLLRLFSVIPCAGAWPA